MTLQQKERRDLVLDLEKFQSKTKTLNKKERA